MFRRILIANRGEIALRIIRACHELGIEAVCVYSRPTPTPPTCAWPTERSASARAPAKDSYLNISRLISAAEIADVDAIHPGYGFLSERADFSPDLPRLQDRVHRPEPRGHGQARRQGRVQAAAKAAKVPIFPGSEGAIEDEDEAVEVAERSATP
jgi:acetyl-CoA carboxylase, biotin carboxylase subunit